MKTFYGTFGNGHTISNGIVEIKAETEEMAREAMFYTFGDKWCTVYDESHKDSEFFSTPIMVIEAIKHDYRDQADFRMVECNYARAGHPGGVVVYPRPYVRSALVACATLVALSDADGEEPEDVCNHLLRSATKLAMEAVRGQLYEEEKQS